MSDAAAPPPPELHHRSHSPRSIPMLLPVFILFFFFLFGFFSIYFLHYLYSTHRRLQPPTASGGESTSPATAEGGAAGGLDPAILATFPTFPYAVVRGLREGKCGLECAICLGEFAGEDAIRLLPVCCHAFHPACIDPWLSLHTTCPLCRADLEAPADAAAVLALEEDGGGERRSGGSYTISVDLDLEQGEEVARGRKSHSTGHSISIGRWRESGDVDHERYTLRLAGIPEERLAAAYHPRNRST